MQIQPIKNSKPSKKKKENRENEGKGKLVKRCAGKRRDDRLFQKVKRTKKGRERKKRETEKESLATNLSISSLCPV